MNKSIDYKTKVFSKRFQTLVRWVVVIVLWVIIGSIAIGKAGIANFMELINERDILLETNIKLEIQNQNLAKEIALLKTSPETQIHLIKETMGMLEQGEFVFQFNDENKNKSSLAKHLEKPMPGHTILSAATNQ